MRQRELFSKTLRETPKDERSKNAEFLIRGGFIDKLMAGVYSFLPLGLRVLRKLEAIIREEMETLGSQEVLMPALHPIENYMRTKRDAIDVLFHVETRSGQKLVLGQSHEEIVVPLVKKYIDSYRDLPFSVYQIQTKFRNELRAKSGVFRGREFLMKDMYSFHAADTDFKEYYEKVKRAYEKVFERVGVGDVTYLTYASGGTFSKFSHEFQTVTDAGEDTIFICDACKVAVNKEIIDSLGRSCPECSRNDLMDHSQTAIEVANIFPLGTRFSEAFDLLFRDEHGERTPIIMGCYGIGISRLLGTVAEAYNDEKGLRWPLAVAPFKVHLIALGPRKKVLEYAEHIYKTFISHGIEVLYDDRDDKTPGEKFADADLIGIPWRIVASEKTAHENKVEVKKRDAPDATHEKLEDFIKRI